MFTLPTSCLQWMRKKETNGSTKLSRLFRNNPVSILDCINYAGIYAYNFFWISRWIYMVVFKCLNNLSIMSDVWCDWYVSDVDFECDRFHVYIKYKEGGWTNLLKLVSDGAGDCKTKCNLNVIVTSKSCRFQICMRNLDPKWNTGDMSAYVF